ncbi:MAG: ABC transporter permease [Candidatus Zixiibacteriota bacterium]|nr:MAG: ABC transporter permease [candidate division Zixibacteria bacterium]
MAKVAFRNVLRQKRRTLLTVLTMMGGFALAAISIAWSDGSYNVIIDKFTRTQLGHIQIHGKGYLDRPTLYNTVDNYEDVGNQVEQLEGVVSWAPRVFSAGLASADDKSAGVRIIGIDPRRENETTYFNKKIVKGRPFDPDSSLEVILGEGLAEVLKADIGDEVVVVSQGADGSIANDLYRVVGLLQSGNAMADQTSFYLTLADAQELLVLYGRVHEVAIVIEDLHDVLMMTDVIEEHLANPELDVESWQEFAHEFYVAMKADQQGNWIMLVIIVLIVATGVLNTVLMTVLERRREYGVLRAMGVRQFQVVRLVLYEVALMAMGSLIIGFIVSFVVNYWLSIDGFTIPDPITYGGVEFSTLYSEINLRSYLIPAVTVIVSALLVSLFPAAKAARTAPARAMRTH